MTFDTLEEKRIFEILYKKYKHLMLKVAYDVLHDYNLSEDAVQNAFIKLSKHMDLVSDVESDRTKRLLITISKNAAIDIYRKHQTRLKHETLVDNFDEDSLSYMASEYKNEIDITSAFNKLPDIYKDIFFLKYSSDYNNEQIAKILGLTQATVRKRLSRGKIILRKLLNI